jgi:hypothetical protein
MGDLYALSVRVFTILGEVADRNMPRRTARKVEVNRGPKNQVWEDAEEVVVVMLHVLPSHVTLLMTTKESDDSLNAKDQIENKFPYNH